jgi:hypothetical protein
MIANIHDLDEERRIALRGELRRKLAGITVVRERIRELRAIIARLDADSDQAAERHQSKTGPLQSELTELDAKHVDSIISGKKTPPKNTSRRAEILQAITAANVVLEDAVSANKRAKKPIEQQIRGLEKQTADSMATKNELAGLASPELHDRQFLLSQRLKWADARRKNAQNYCDKNIAGIEQAKQENDGKRVRILTRRLHGWQLDADDAAEIIATCHREMAELQTQMMADG